MSSRKYYTWTRHNDQTLIDGWGRIPATDIARLLNRTAASIRNRARRLNLPRVDYETRVIFHQVIMARQPHRQKDKDGIMGSDRALLASERRIPVDPEHLAWCAYWQEHRKLRLQRIEAENPSAHRS